jgi:hypothetical protein
VSLHTKNGRPLEVSDDVVYNSSGQAVGRIRGDKVYGPDGRYVGTIAGDRLVYRSTDSVGIGAPFLAPLRGGFVRAQAAGSAIFGDEPDIPD